MRSGFQNPLDVGITFFFFFENDVGITQIVINKKTKKKIIKKRESKGYHIKLNME